MKRKSKMLLYGWFVVFLGALFYCYEYLLRVSPSAMSSNLIGYFHLDGATFGNLQAYYYYIYVPMQLLVGILFDRYGPRRLLTLATFSCTAGIYIFASSHSILVAELGRFMMGFGSAFAFVGVLKLATIWLPPERFAFISGLAVALGMVGGITGDVVLTALVNTLTWQNTCFWAAGVGALLTLAMFLFVRDRNHHMRDMQDIQLHSAKLAWPELKKVIMSGQFWINAAIGCLLYLPLSAYAELWSIPFLKEAHHFSASQAANTNSLIFLGWAIGGPIVGFLSDALRKRPMLITAGAVASIATICAILYVPSPSLSTMRIFYFLFGMFSSAQVLTFAVAREISPKSLTGTALAGTNMVVMIGGFLVPVIGWLLDMVWNGTYLAHQVPLYTLSNFQFALSLLPILLGACLLLTFFLRETAGINLRKYQ